MANNRPLQHVWNSRRSIASKIHGRAWRQSNRRSVMCPNWQLCRADEISLVTVPIRTRSSKASAGTRSNRDWVLCVSSMRWTMWTMWSPPSNTSRNMEGWPIALSATRSILISLGWNVSRRCWRGNRFPRRSSRMPISWIKPSKWRHWVQTWSRSRTWAVWFHRNG